MIYKLDDNYYSPKAKNYLGERWLLSRVGMVTVYPINAYVLENGIFVEEI